MTPTTIVHDTLPARVAILFANLKGNLGDFAILQAMVYQLRVAYPGCSIDVHAHPLVPVDEERLAGFRRDNRDLFFPGATPRPAVSGWERLAMSSPLARIMQCRRIGRHARDMSAAFADFSKYDTVCFAGGDQWSGKDLGLSMFATLQAIHRVNPEIYAFPFSLKTSITGLYRPDKLKEYFSLLRQPVIVRDSLSQENMRQLGIRSVQGADCVYSIPDEMIAAAPAAACAPERVLFAVKGQPENLATTIAPLLADGVRLELLTTCPEEDDRVYRKLAERFDIPYHRPNTWVELVSELRASRVVVTNRLHGLILGSLAKALLLPVTDRKKSLAFVRDAKIPLCAATPADVTVELLTRVQTRAADMLEQICEYRERCRSEAISPVKSPQS